MFPRKFLEKCQAISSSNDDPIAFDQTSDLAFKMTHQRLRQRSKVSNSASMHNCAAASDYGRSVLNDEASFGNRRPSGGGASRTAHHTSKNRVTAERDSSGELAQRVNCSLPSVTSAVAVASAIPESEAEHRAARSSSNRNRFFADADDGGDASSKPRSLHQSFKAKSRPKREAVASASAMNISKQSAEELGMRELSVDGRAALSSSSCSENDLTISNDDSSKS